MMGRGMKISGVEDVQLDRRRSEHEEILKMAHIPA